MNKHGTITRDHHCRWWPAGNAEITGPDSYFPRLRSRPANPAAALPRQAGDCSRVETVCRGCPQPVTGASPRAPPPAHPSHALCPHARRQHGEATAQHRARRT
jgi:hypothetical protein